MRAARESRRARRAPAMVLGAWALSALLVAALPASAAIGHRQATYEDPARSNRAVLTEVYYPAEAAGDDVPIAAGHFPIVVCGHGYLLPWDNYLYLWTGLVAAGYVVALPRTEMGLFPDHLDLGLDLAFLVRTLRAEADDPLSPFYQALDSAAAVIGHSMGGGASFLGAESEPSITALANLAAAETNPSAIAAAAGVSMPALVFSGSLDCVTPPEDHQEPMYLALASPCKTAITITGASHCQFAEENWTCSLGEAGCPDPTITRSEQQDCVLLHLIPWLDYVLKGEAEGWNTFQALLEEGSGITWVQDCIPQSLDPPADRGSANALALRLVPNPIHDRVEFAFPLAQEGEVELAIYGIDGRCRQTLLRRTLSPGTHRVAWDRRRSTADRLSGGVYFARLSAGGHSVAARLLLIP